jgi:UDP-N-acetylmuramoylalanine--D-glutamate ligase
VQWQGKRVGLIGLGISNMAVARYLSAHGARITACDRKEAPMLGSRLHELLALGVQLQLGAGYLRELDRFDVVFLAPGVPKHLPELKAAEQSGVVLSSEMNLFFSLCRAPIIGVTGSSGKTTTTTLIGEIMATAGIIVHVGGNIGKPLVEEVERIDPQSWVLLELSSFQLELLRQSPQLALITNVTPNHLDVHASMAEYIAAKSHVYRYQKPQNWAIFNADNPTTSRLAGEAPGQVAWFSTQRQVKRGACVVEGRIMLARDGILQEVCRQSEIKLMGAHNLENVLAAAVLADLVGCPPGVIRDVVTSFTGVEHRLELVREADGVAYYNDSKATTPAGAIAALQAFQRPVVLIAGGYDKHLPFDELGAVVAQRAKAVVLLGATKNKIAAAISAAAGDGRKPPVQFAASLEEAVALAKSLAAPGDVVLLSPACASYDMFANFEERGERFRAIVRSLTEAETPARS